MKPFVTTVFLMGAALWLTSCDGGRNRAADDLHALFDEDWEWTLQEYPEFATYLGDDRYNDRLDDLSLAAVERQQHYAQETLERLQAVDRDALTPEDQLNFDLFLGDLETALEGYTYKAHLMPVNQMDGAQIGLPTLPALTKFRHLKDYRDYLLRLEEVPRQLAQITARLQRGMDEGWVMPRVPLRSVPDQIKAQFDIKLENSPFYRPFTKFPLPVSATDQASLIREATQTITDQVLPAFERFHRFFTETYLPAARDDVGVWALPGGEAYYAHRVRTITTTDLTPDEIHAIGLSEVQRIRGEMDRVIAEAGFAGDFDGFTRFLRTDPQFYYTDPEELLRGYRDICKRIDPQLTQLFGHLPRMPYGVEEIPDYEAPASTTAYYRRPAADGSRPGIFYANTYRLETRPKYEMEALTIHEAVPGHHLQIAIAQELGELPNFRKYGGYTAFVEGWGLYAESLGEQLGFYQNPYPKFGQLSYEMWRAVRLVVDTGLHHKKWTRQQAIDFFEANTGLTEHNIIAEVDRYIVWPGQALAYKLGELKIRQLRTKAREALGERFDIREFHDVILGRGALPLSILEEGVMGWIGEEQSR